ncbi:hypothetical protein ACFB49_47730 [Sphingomonas sp. DBB INV C78]|uniref:hypothetical protein n=1 Tax=Sphingomonas sp. DBB INV C78 TaxID=3349434 RepID=UPI0036D232F6
MPAAIREPDQETGLPLDAIAGSWFIRATSFPMWLDGKRHRPTLNYAPGNRRLRSGLIDEVRYEQAARERVVRGFDFPSDATNRHFLWRGSGLLTPFSSRWSIRHLDAGGEWMFIAFERTWFTPAGYDLVARDAAMGAASVEEALSAAGAAGLDSIRILSI